VVGHRTDKCHHWTLLSSVRLGEAGEAPTAPVIPADDDRSVVEWLGLAFGR